MRVHTAQAGEVEQPPPKEVRAVAQGSKFQRREPVKPAVKPAATEAFYGRAPQHSTEHEGSFSESQTPTGCSVKRLNGRYRLLDGYLKRKARSR
jgi:hypothetical protein